MKLYLFSIIPVIIAAVVFALCAFAFGVLFGKLTARKHLHKEITAARTDAVKRSRAVLNGQISEQLAAFFLDFPADPTEIRFIGKPVDFIAFSGSSAGTVDEILFIEVKTGGSALTKIERSLKDAVAQKRIRYCEYRIPDGHC